MTAPANLLTEWARLAAGTLGAAGVREVVISPGSRSTPFAWALLHVDGLRCRWGVDERDAAFFAVGHARMTGRPVALLCTSGSAAANYYPAVVEAARSRTPLVVMTADRPPELQAADAPQTIDQTRLYGTFARSYLSPGPPEASDGALRGLQRTVARAVHDARWPVPGPVQVNLPARKPLEPVEADDEAGSDLRRRVDDLLARGPTRPSPPRMTADPDAVERLAAACRDARRGVIVSGPIAPWRAPDPSRVASLALRTGFAVLPEAAGQLRFSGALPDDRTCDVFDPLLRSPTFPPTFDPDLVLQLGPAPTSTGWREWVARSDAPRHVLSPDAWSDPASSAASLVLGPLNATLDALTEALGPGEGDTTWARWLAGAAATARSAIHACLEAEPEDSEGRAVRAALDAVPRGAVLALGNSLPVREVDTFGPAGDRELVVWSQRGASGIDGLVAGAAGAAAATGRPTVLLLGDVSLLHDIGGLATARHADRPLVVVVLDNGGGRIFDQLPLARSGALDHGTRRYWTTPTGVDLEAAARAFGIRYTATADPGALADAVERAAGTDGATLVHAHLDGDRTLPLHREIWRRVAEDVPPPPA